MSESIWANVAIGGFGLIGVIVAGVLGYQSGSNAVNKDYVQLAATMLTNKESSPELRKWSVDVLNKMSPVPFTQKQKEVLTGAIVPVFMPPVPQNKVGLTKNMRELCPDVIKNAPKEMTREWMLFVLEKYERCRARHNVMVDYITKYDALIDDSNARMAKIAGHPVLPTK
ncbi:hypothetical protein SCH01S_14_00240 [Sphingomonas changbaiensis NBRC 104936]|uniref:Uncharacterized protein n=1 Tax=Sphingomonas changbaiensis NBRC 104936 TaxID=1219043 RepID=A0A0E9MML8_9SPHN|nr:hypothetical protein [Sphingomonas changbaiensis]GAO38360.1 hypothetical protein SCH01S_14_00240 [Sphingomonas changbaiensis NBRC 104936]